MLTVPAMPRSMARGTKCSVIADATIAERSARTRARRDSRPVSSPTGTRSRSLRRWDPRVGASLGPCAIVRVPARLAARERGAQGDGDRGAAAHGYRAHSCGALALRGVSAGRMRSANGHSLTVVVPVYNEYRVLGELVRETFQAIDATACVGEMVCVDDGSHDGSSNLLDELARSEPRLKVIHLARNFGHQAAVQAGLAHAPGDLVIVMDADCRTIPPRLESSFVSGRRGTTSCSRCARAARRTRSRRRCSDRSTACSVPSRSAASRTTRGTTGSWIAASSTRCSSSRSATATCPGSGAGSASARSACRSRAVPDTTARRACRGRDSGASRSPPSSRSRRCRSRSSTSSRPQRWPSPSGSSRSRSTTSSSPAARSSGGRRSSWWRASSAR